MDHIDTLLRILEVLGFVIMSAIAVGRWVGKEESRRTIFPRVTPPKTDMSGTLDERVFRLEQMCGTYVTRGEFASFERRADIEITQLREAVNQQSRRLDNLFGYGAKDGR